MNFGNLNYSKSDENIICRCRCQSNLIYSLEWILRSNCLTFVMNNGDEECGNTLDNPSIH